MAQLIDDTIDFNAYLAEPEAKQKVRPANSYCDEVIASFLLPPEARGLYLPWRLMDGKLRLRRGELTLWPGINGHGKSLAVNQAMLFAIAQGEKALIASMEMRPVKTLERMARQATRLGNPSPKTIREFHAWTDDRLWIYDHMGSVVWRKLIAVLRYCAVEIGITQFVLDSLMRCGIAETDYDGQKAFIDALCQFKNDYNVGVHLVMHSRKREDEMTAPGKFDAKGTGTITDLADNVLTVWRNKKKEAQVQACETRGDLIPEDVRLQPDALLICDKQRHFDWEGKLSLWYHRESMQFLDSRSGLPQNPMEWGAE